MPCSRIAQAASNFSCDVRIIREHVTVDAKNIFDVMSLSAEYGTTLALQAFGEGASEAIQELVKLFESNFNCEESVDT